MSRTISQQVPSGLFRPGIIGHFQQFFKYSKYGPIAFIFFSNSHIYKFSSTQKKSGSLQRPGASADRKHHSVKKTDKKCRGKNLMLANKLITHRIDSFLFFFWMICHLNGLKKICEKNQVEICIISATVMICIKYAVKWT